MTIKIEDLHNIDFSDVAVKGKRLPNITPGEILRHDFMEPLGLSANALANAIRVPANQIIAILDLKKPRAVTADTALRLAAYFGNSEKFWVNLQSDYDLEEARKINQADLKSITPIAA